jgi:hypothetical protein
MNHMVFEPNPCPEFQGLGFSHSLVDLVMNWIHNHLGVPMKSNHLGYYFGFVFNYPDQFSNF